MSDPLGAEHTGLTEHGEEPLDDYDVGGLEGWLLRLGTLGELLALLVRNGRWWMLPLVIVLVVAGIGLLVIQAAQVVLPFIYI